MGKVVIGKTLSLRPTKREAQNLVLYMEKHKLKKATFALKKILTELTLEDKTTTPQLEREKPVESPFSQTSKATGILIKCPLRAIGVPYEKPFVHWKPPVDTSVCKTCSKYPCESWEDIESWKRTARPTTQPTTKRA